MATNPWWLVSLCLSVTACQTFDPKRAEDALTDRDVCCESYGEMEFQSLPIGKKVDLALNPDGPIFRFRNGKAFFRAMALPSWSEPLQLSLYTLAIRDKDEGSVIRPVVKMLDREFHETRELVADNKRHWTERGYELTIFINDENRDEAYVVVYPYAMDDGMEPVKAEYAVALYGAGILLNPMQFSAGEKTYRYRYGKTGQLSIWLRPYFHRVGDRKDSPAN